MNETIKTSGDDEAGDKNEGRRWRRRRKRGETMKETINTSGDDEGDDENEGRR
jgi:hypothetical protein